MNTLQAVKVGDKVRVNIKVRESYTDDLYNAIQGEIGVITQKQSKLSTYNNAWLVKFSDKTKKKYAKTHSGKWGGASWNPDYVMEWWTEEKDFEVIA